MTTFKKASGSLFALALGLLVLPAAPAAADSDGSYGYVRAIEGSATLIPTGSSDRDSAEINQPVLAGDRLIVPGRSRMELVLADRNIVRLDGGSEVILERLAASPDSNDRATVLRLLEGNLQLVVLTDSLGEELPRIETPNATIYTQHYGNYRVTADRDGWSEIVVRQGKAEVVTERGAVEVRADEMALIEGEARQADVDVRAADTYDNLERWGRRMDEEYASAGDDLRYVDDNLRYAAAPLSRHGSWISYENRNYWRPRVDAGWRPYWHGRWVYTPSGSTWVSSEPWGWVPYHYGSWDYIPRYGWVWEPGYVYSPAWVYWYWGPSHVGWCPTGYYTRYYGSGFGHGSGFRHGVYGWAGGDWGYFDRWTFVGSDYFRSGYRRGYRDGYRDGRHDDRWDVRRHAVPIDQLRRTAHEMPRGIVTTDTRQITPDRARNTQDVLRTLRDQRTGRGGADLPDVSSFVARRPELSDDLRRQLVADRNDNDRLAGTPLRPDTLGRRTGRPSGETLGGALNGRGGDGRTATPGKPRVVFGDDDRRRPDARGSRPDAGDSPVNSKPNVRPDTGSSARENGPRPGRPSAGADGGSPRPEVLDRARRGSDDGGSPRPDRPTLEVRPRSRPDSDGDRTPSARPDSESRPRPSTPSARPEPRERPSAREESDDDSRSRSVERPSARPERPRVEREERPDRGAERSRPQARPDPPSYQSYRPETRRPETRSVPDRPTVRERDVERVRPSYTPPSRDREASRPSYTPRSSERSPERPSYTPRSSERSSDRPSYTPRSSDRSSDRPSARSSSPSRSRESARPSSSSRSRSRSNGRDRN